ncbi:MAG: hypothetical protein LQ340_007178, partial [Diploschistes diacapsis]
MTLDVHPSLHQRGLSSAVLTGNDFTEQQRLAQQIISIVASSVSIIAGAISLYWFFRMRTHFRHHLIILLICSDLFKAIWYFIPAAVGVAGHQGSSNNRFCQASGFLLAFGIEASDFAILIIAIHSALCIFKPRTSPGESGLYNLRHVVYALWILIPTLMAGLALMQGGAYIDQGAFCYLPIRPFWYRLGLAWIPRYLIFMTICFLYVRIYWFVGAKFKQFDLDSDGSHQQPSDHRTWHSISQPRPNHARIASTSLLADGATEGGPSGRGSRSQPTTPVNAGLDSENVYRDDSPCQASNGPAWENYTFGNPKKPTPSSEDDDAAPIPAQAIREKQSKPSSCSDGGTAVANTSPTVASLTQALGDTGPDFITTPSSPAKATSRSADIRPTMPSTPVTPARTPRPTLPERPDGRYVTAEGMRMRHTAIKRQLRLLFIYPVVYLVSWLVPLAQHLSLYWDNVAARPLFDLACASTFFLALQCAVDAFIFSTRETPWRYIRHPSSSNARDSECPTAVDDTDPAPAAKKWAFWRPRPSPGTAGPIDSQIPTRASEKPSSCFTIPRIHSTFSFRSTITTAGGHRGCGGSGNFGAGTRGSTTTRSALPLPIPLPLRASAATTTAKGGKSKGEMVAEARVARLRRDVELSLAKEVRAEKERRRKMSLSRRDGREKA